MNKDSRDSNVHTAGNQRSNPRPGANRLPIDALLDGKPEVIIEHAGEDYRLRITSKGKLILTK